MIFKEVKWGQPYTQTKWVDVIDYKSFPEVKWQEINQFFFQGVLFFFQAKTNVYGLVLQAAFYLLPKSNVIHTHMMKFNLIWTFSRSK